MSCNILLWHSLQVAVGWFQFKSSLCAHLSSFSFENPMTNTCYKLKTISTTIADIWLISDSTISLAGHNMVNTTNNNNKPKNIGHQLSFLWLDLLLPNFLFCEWGDTSLCSVMVHLTFHCKVIFTINLIIDCSNSRFSLEREES